METKKDDRIHNGRDRAEVYHANHSTKRKRKGELRSRAVQIVDSKEPSFQRRANRGWEYLMKDVRKAIDKSGLWYQILLAASLIIAGAFILWITGIFF